MNPNDFKAFCCLMQEVHYKVFGEAPENMNFARARALSSTIFETTGCWISYKSLMHFTNAACSGIATAINPRDSTLAILVFFLQDKNWQVSVSDTNVLLWYKYRFEKIQENA